MSELRQKKFARTRLALATALTNALAEQPLNDISVRALCHAAEVSEATFFNYFPGKQDLMGYLAQLWLLELGWQAAKAAQNAPGLSALQQLFAHTARTCTRRPGLMRELIAWLVHGGAPDTMQQPGQFELKLAFPELEGIEATPLKGIDALIVPQLEAAIRAGELPENILIPTVLSLLLAILFGVPLTLLSSHPARIADLYQQQLQLVWSGVRSAASGSRQ